MQVPTDIWRLIIDSSPTDQVFTLAVTCRYLNRVVKAHNLFWRRVCEKLGLRFEGIQRQDRYLMPPDADRHDGTFGYLYTNSFAVLSGEWDCARRRLAD